VAVVGGGPGGYSAAFRCAELGLETVVVDASRRLGGACLWEGCIPSKALLHVSAVLGEVERAKEFGVDFGEPRIALDALRKWKAERVVGKLARGLAGVAKAKGVEIVGGLGVFEDSRALRVEGDEPQKIRFKHAVVATRSRHCGKLFVKIRLGTKVTSLHEQGSQIEARFGEGDTVAFDRVLVAVGRRPVSAELGLETTRVRPDAHGFVAVDERCRTADP